MHQNTNPSYQKISVNSSNQTSQMNFEWKNFHSNFVSLIWQLKWSLIEEICRYHQFALEILQILPFIIGRTFKGNWQSLETLISNKWNEILPFKLHFILFGWNAMREINIFDWTHFQRKSMISGDSYKLTNEMKFFQSNFLSFWLEYNEGNQFLAQEKWSLDQKCNTTFLCSLIYFL